MPAKNEVVTVSKEGGVTILRKTATISEFMGRTLDKPIEYSWDFPQYADKATAVANQKWPSDVDVTVLNQVNKTAESSARAAAANAATAKLREEYEASPEFKLKQLVDSIMATGKSQEVATKMAQSIMAQ